MTTKTFQDGDTLELRWSGNGNPPGATGQATASSSIWFRVNGGAWERGSSRTMHKNMEALAVADSVAEFRELMEIL